MTTKTTTTTTTNDKNKQQKQQQLSKQYSSSSSSSSSIMVVVDKDCKTTNTTTTTRRKEFIWDDNDEPHASRRKRILAKYPQIKQLYGHDPNFKYIVLSVIAIQLGMAYHVQQKISTMSWYTFLLLAYIIGGTCNHMFMMAMHELCHNLGFAKPIHNRIFSIVANLPIGIPSAISFKRYHIEHHRYQGEHHIDMDIPSYLEGNVIGNSTLFKLFFVTFQIAFYGLRPVILSPKQPTIWEAYNFIACITFDIIVLQCIGSRALMYLLLSTLLGAGLHPVAGHFISEHYIFNKGYETYSYYGLLNILTFNVGYHNEHHDFPYVPGSRLPQVRAIAAEFYDPLPVCECWITVLYNYITNPDITPFSRTKRQRLSNDEIQKIKLQ